MVRSEKVACAIVVTRAKKKSSLQKSCCLKVACKIDLMEARFDFGKIVFNCAKVVTSNKLTFLFKMTLCITKTFAKNTLVLSKATINLGCN